MNILVAFPTDIEAKGFIPCESAHTVHVLISGVAIYNTIYNLTQYCCTHKPDIVLYAGIAGSFSNSYVYADVVHVTEDCFADTGVVENARFLNLFDLGLESPNAFPFTDGYIRVLPTFCPPHIPQVRGITVNEITSSETRKNMLQQKYAPAIESMEGAAAHFVCAHQNIPCIHLRSISNIVGDRNKNNWQISKAIQSLHVEINATIKSLCI